MVKIRLAWKAGVPRVRREVVSATAQRGRRGVRDDRPARGERHDVRLERHPGTQLRFRLRATDREGNVSGYVSWPTLTPSKFEEASSLAAYTGSWTPSSNTKMSGGKGRWAGRRRLG